MNKFVITLLASTALAIPAFAAPMNNPPPKQPQQQSQMQQPSAQPSAQQNQQAQNTQQEKQQASYVKPSQLSHTQVRKIQEALNKQGFGVGHVDGIWGRKTQHAVRRFDQAKNIQANGRLTQQTLSDLGVQMASNQNNGNTSNGGQAQTPNQAPNTMNNSQGQNGQ